MQHSQMSGRIALVWGVLVTSLALVGCGADYEDYHEFEEQPVDEVSQALVTCQGQSCDGLLPRDTTCGLDAQVVGSGAVIFDAQGRQLGGLALFRSQRCQTVWAKSEFYYGLGPQNFRVCTVRRRASFNDSSCQDYFGTLRGDGPMKFADSGKVVYGRNIRDGVATRTNDYVVP